MTLFEYLKYILNHDISYMRQEENSINIEKSLSKKLMLGINDTLQSK